MKKKDQDFFSNKRLFYGSIIAAVAVVAVIGVGVTVNQNNRQSELDIIRDEINTVDKMKDETIPKVTLDDVANASGAIAGVMEDEDTIIAFNTSEAGNHTQPEEQAPAQEQNTSQATPQEEKAEPQPEDVQTFSDGQSMVWPVDGDIIMAYNMDHPYVYDATLEQYRTNASICIEGPLGTQVKAAYHGTVEEVVKDDNEKGNVVVLNHGNGWKTTYSQLQEGILVEEGQYVQTGQVIGGIGSPTKYSVLLGEHLSFEVTKDDQPADPLNLLVAMDE